MDRRQLLVGRARELFGERLDDVVEMVRQDRQELRGWQEPAHVRGVMRRLERQEGGAPSERTFSATTFAELELGRAAGEPERGQQREATGQLLEAGARGLEKASRRDGELTAEEALGLECVLLTYARPAVLVANGALSSPPPLWNVLEDQREEVETNARGVGRIELLGHPELDWAGTGFLVGDGVLLTTRKTAEVFAERRGDEWQFRPGISAWMNYRSTFQDVASAGYRVRRVFGVHEVYDLALLEVENSRVNGPAPTPLALASTPPPRLEGRPVYLIGYPVRDARRSEPEAVTRIFRDVFNVKRVQPGLARGELTFHEVTFLRDDCGPLGQGAGAALIDLESNQVLGVRTASRYLEEGTAVPLYRLRDDPLFRRAGVTFAEATPQERQAVGEQIDRLARTRYWNETREAIAAIYRRAFERCW